MFKGIKTKFRFSNAITLAVSTIALSGAMYTNAAGGRMDYDQDNNGLIEINDLADLSEMRNDMNGTTLYGSDAGCPDAADSTVNRGCNGYELTTDLDFDTNQDGVINSNDTYWNGGEGWVPIGVKYKTFSAHFNGNGYVIYNLYIDRPNSSYQGLFDYTRGASLSNVGLSGPMMQVKGSTGIGALVGNAYTTEIQGCFNTGLVQGTHSVGGLVGYASRYVVINQSYNTGTVKNSGDNSGGLVGYVQDNSAVMNSFNIGSVQGERNTGGLVGYAYKRSSIRQSFNTGSLSGGNYTGGLVGRANRNIVVTNTFNTGLVQSDGVYIGGLVGFARGIVISQSLNSGYVTGSNHTGGLAGELSGSIENSYWATDTSGQDTSYVSSEANSHVGLIVTKLQCAVQANTTSNNSSCVSNDGSEEGLNGPVTLFKSWDETVWDFGNSIQLPALVLNGEIYRDSDGDGILDDDDVYPYDYNDSIGSFND